MCKISSFRSIENKHDVYRGKACMKTFCKLLRERAMKIINFKKLKLLSKEQKMQMQMIGKCKNLLYF